MSPGALYSFAIVLFFTDYVKETSIEAIMRRCLYDFDWEEHAEDVSEESNRVWKDVFIDRTLHWCMKKGALYICDLAGKLITPLSGVMQFVPSSQFLL